jgi:prolycopene isomerase
MEKWRTFDETDLKEHEKKVAEIFIDRLERYFNGIKNHIQTVEIASPVTFANISGNPSGAIYGVSQTAGQSGVNRLYSTTPIKGLYLAGADIFPGAGYRSVMSSGYKVAKHILSLMN